VLSLAVVLPTPTPAPMAAEAAGRGVAAAGLRIEPAMEALELVGGIDLQRPLYDAPPPAPLPTPDPVKPPPLALQLAGTIIDADPSRSRAILILPDGTSKLHGVGDRIGDAELLVIEDEEITVRYHGDEVVLKRPKPGDPP